MITFSSWFFFKSQLRIPSTFNTCQLFWQNFHELQHVSRSVYQNPAVSLCLTVLKLVIPNSNNHRSHFHDLQRSFHLVNIQQFLLLSFFTFTLYHSVLLISGWTFMISGLFLTYRTRASSISMSYCAITLLRVDELRRASHLFYHQAITEPDQPEPASPYSFLIIFMSSGVLLTRFSIQDSQGLSSLPYSIPPLLFRLHFHDLRRASNLLQHSGLARPYVSSPYSILFVSGSTFMSSDVLLTYFSIQQSLGHASSPYSILFFLGCTFMSSGVLLTYFSIQQSLGLTTLTYGLMFGFGTALAYAPPMGVAMRWFPRQKGLVNGIIVGGFGLGAFIFNQASPVGWH